MHVMHNLFETSEAEAIIFVDAANPFNSLNRKAVLHNIQHLCPSLAKVLINMYREDVRLFVDRETVLSQERTTQGDPLAMAMYAITITSLINHVESEQIKQVWFADDATAGGELSSLRSWIMVGLGPDYGYHPNATKTWLIVNKSILEEATTFFEGTGVAISVEGIRHLGAVIGTPAEFHPKLCSEKDGWLGQRDRTPFLYCHLSTSCSICCLHSWPNTQMDIFLKDHPKS